MTASLYRFVVFPTPPLLTFRGATLDQKWGLPAVPSSSSSLSQLPMLGGRGMLSKLTGP